MCEVYRVKRYAGSQVGVDSAKEMCLDALKEMLWRDVWKDVIDVPGVRWTIEESEDGVIEVTAEVGL